MRQIWKYSLSGSSALLEMPAGAQVLCVQMQRGQPMLWALVDTDQPKTERQFVIVGTGHVVDDDDEAHHYIGTAQYGAFVWHIFEKRPA